LSAHRLLRCAGIVVNLPIISLALDALYTSARRFTNSRAEVIAAEHMLLIL